MSTNLFRYALFDTKTTERSLTDQPFPHLLHALCFLLTQKCCGKKYFGLVDVVQRELEINTVMGTEWEDLNAIIPTIHGNFFCGLSISTIL